MVYVFLAEGFEEIDALTVVDLGRRAGLDVQTVSVSGDRNVTGARGIPVVADKTLAETDWDAADMLVLPGGMPGTLNLKACAKLSETLLKADAEGKVIAAICAAPSVLGGLGLLKGKKAVCFPGFENALEGAKVVKASVCRDGRIITAKGMGAAFEFAFALTELLFGPDTATELKKGVQYN